MQWQEQYSCLLIMPWRQIIFSLYLSVQVGGSFIVLETFEQDIDEYIFFPFNLLIDKNVKEEERERRAPVERVHPHVDLVAERRMKSSFSSFPQRNLIESGLHFFPWSWQDTVNSHARASRPIWCN